jgi:hypothetical protein
MRPPAEPPHPRAAPLQLDLAVVRQSLEHERDLEPVDPVVEAEGVSELGRGAPVVVELVEERSAKLEQGEAAAQNGISSALS